MRSKRIIKDIAKAEQSAIYEFWDDKEGRLGDAESCYLRFWFNEGPYVGQVHIVQIQFIYGSNTIYKYPRNPPNVSFVTPMYHANVWQKGTICLDILKKKYAGSTANGWSPLYDVDAIVSSLQLLLEQPNYGSPAHGEASRAHKTAYKNGKPEEFAAASMKYYMDNLSHNNAVKLLALDEFKSGMSEEDLIKGYEYRRAILGQLGIEI